MANDPKPPDAPAELAVETPAEPKEPKPVTPTLFYLFTGSDDMEYWQFIGVETARDRDHAIRLRYPDPTEGHAGNIVAVSDPAWKPRRRVLVTKPAAKLNEVTMPTAHNPIPLPAAQTAEKS